MKAELHPREHSRLAQLRRYAILDTRREADFDAIVELAAELCEAPAAQINFIDDVRQWSKAEVGVGIQTIPLEMSICAHALLEDGFVEIPDLLADPRMSDNPACLGAPFVRFYAGMQLRGSNGDPIGTLCVLDMKPRKLTALQRRSLMVLADQVVAQLNLRETLRYERILRGEIDHRVKNSLQSIGSYVSLERAVSTSEEATEVLRGVEQQINMVAELHGHLSSVRGESALALAPYLDRVTELLVSIAPATVCLTGQFQPAQINPKSGAIVGTIINELVANAIKHSFLTARGAIAMTGELASEGRYRITVQDDGSSPAIPDSRAKRVGLGLAIIKASVRQLNGSIESMMTVSGYRTVFEFEL